MPSACRGALGQHRRHALGIRVPHALDDECSRDQLVLAANFHLCRIGLGLAGGRRPDLNARDAGLRGQFVHQRIRSRRRRECAVGPAAPPQTIPPDPPRSAADRTPCAPCCGTRSWSSASRASGSPAAAGRPATSARPGCPPRRTRRSGDRRPTRPRSAARSETPARRRAPADAPGCTSARSARSPRGRCRSRSQECPAWLSLSLRAAWPPPRAAPERKLQRRSPQTAPP